MTGAWERKREQEAQRQRDHSKSARDIAPLPPVKNKRRRNKCRKNLKLFCETYFTEVFCSSWSDDHLKLIKKLEHAILHGGKFAFASPRGTGKTALTRAASKWATLYGHRKYVALIAASEDAAVKLLDGIKTHFESNALLLADFPEVCYPIRQLEGIVGRCAGQTHEGKRTRVTWTQKQITLPTITGSDASGAIFGVCGITGRIRGLEIVDAETGKQIRPDFIIIDDPQTDASAASAAQNQTRLDTLCGAILGLGGPTTEISAVMPCTVIRPGDMVDRVLDNKKHPEWRGERTKLVYHWPTNEVLWDEYSDIRRHCHLSGDMDPANDFYLDHQDEMDEGAVVAWDERKKQNEVSAIQSAWNLRMDIGEAAFAAEYQNEPLSIDDNSANRITITAEDIAVGKTARGLVPADAVRLVSFIDVHDHILYFVVLAVAADFSGTVIDYGTWPDQRRSYFAQARPPIPIEKISKKKTAETRLDDALTQLTDHLLSTDYPTENGDIKRIERCMIDAAYRTAIIKQFCRRSPHTDKLLPSIGYPIAGAKMPMDQWVKNPAGLRKGWSWRIEPKAGEVPHILIDVYSWRTFTAERLLIGDDAGGIRLFKLPVSKHRLFAEHMAAEKPKLDAAAAAFGRTVFVWSLKPGLDNHWWDCLVGCLVAASEMGVIALGHSENRTKPIKKRKRKKYTAKF